MKNYKEIQNYVRTSLGFEHFLLFAKHKRLLSSLLIFIAIAIT